MPSVPRSGVVLAMLEIKVPGESARGWRPARRLGKEARDVASVVLELVEALAKEVLLGEDDRKIDGEEHDDHDGGNPQAARGDGESECDDERSEIERIARVCVRTAGGELLVLVDVSGSERADEDAGSGE